MFTVRVSLLGIPADEVNPDPRDYALLADDDNVLIKELARGTTDIDQGNTFNVEHSLGYFPHFYTYGEITPGRFQIINGFNLFGDFRSYVDNDKLYITNVNGVDPAETRYFIFYDDIPEV